MGPPLGAALLKSYEKCDMRDEKLPNLSGVLFEKALNCLERDKNGKTETKMGTSLGN